MYRHLQNEGLQQEYEDIDDLSIRGGAQLLVAVAFLPPDYLKCHSNLLKKKFLLKLPDTCISRKRTSQVQLRNVEVRKKVKPLPHSSVQSRGAGAIQ